MFGQVSYCFLSSEHQLEKEEEEQDVKNAKVLF